MKETASNLYGGNISVAMQNTTHLNREEVMADSVLKIKEYAKKNSIELITSKNNNFIMKEGSTFVYITIHNDEAGEWVVFFSFVVKGAEMTEDLMKNLLTLNASLPFGGFGIQQDYIIFKHCILGDPHMDEDEFVQSLISVARVADEYDNKIIQSYGGKTAMDILIEDLFHK